MTKATMVKFIPCVLSLAVALSTGSSMESAQRAQQPSVAALDVQKLTESVYVIKGGGGNSTIFIGSKGVVLVDAKTPDGHTPFSKKSRPSPTNQPSCSSIRIATGIIRAEMSKCQLEWRS